MKRSDEVRDVVARFYDRISAGDVEGASATIADDPDAFVIGTQRIGDGREAWIDSIRENAEMGVAFKAGEIRAWADGNSGWAVDETAIVLPNGVAFTTRTTFVAHREPDGAFRLLHMNASWAVPDEIALEHAHAWRAQLGLQEAT
jgi:ketosteroid isomerase-like protein